MTKKEIQLEMLESLHAAIKLHMSHNTDIMSFYGYDEETEEYDTVYKGPGKPTHADFKLASIFMYMKHGFEQDNHMGLSFDMKIYGE